MKYFLPQEFVLALCLFCRPTQATAWEVGSTIPKITAQDQHGAAYVLTNGTRFLLIATEMASAKAANQKLAAQAAGFLEERHAVYLMDIHTMPGIARMFAFPKLRKYPHRIVLVDDAETLSQAPVKPGQITVLTLTPAGRIEKISYWDPAKEPVTSVVQ